MPRGKKVTGIKKYFKPIAEWKLGLTNIVGIGAILYTLLFGAYTGISKAHAQWGKIDATLVLAQKVDCKITLVKSDRKLEKLKHEHNIIFINYVDKKRKMSPYMAERYIDLQDQIKKLQKKVDNLEAKCGDDEA